MALFLVTSFIALLISLHTYQICRHSFCIISENNCFMSKLKLFYNECRENIVYIYCSRRPRCIDLFCDTIPVAPLNQCTYITHTISSNECHLEMLLKLQICSERIDPSWQLFNILLPRFARITPPTDFYNCCNKTLLDCVERLMLLIQTY